MNLIQSLATPAWAAGLKVITSKCRHCDRSMALRQISAHKAGIKMHDWWYCSSRCFTAAAEKELWALLPPSVEHGSQFSRMPLGLNLISRGLLTSAQYKKAVEEQKRAGGEIGELIVRSGSLSERQVTDVVAAQWGCPVFSMPRHLVRTRVHIPFTLIKLNSAIPLHYVSASNLLLVGFVHGIRYGLLSAIEQIIGCKTQPCFVTPSDFQSEQRHLERARDRQGDTSGQEVKFENAQTSREMAENLCNHCVDHEADEVIIKRCNEYIWARLKSGSRETDLLFKAE